VGGGVCGVAGSKSMHMKIKFYTLDSSVLQIAPGI